jgi:hypothetical protein
MIGWHRAARLFDQSNPFAAHDDLPARQNTIRQDHRTVDKEERFHDSVVLGNLGGPRDWDLRKLCGLFRLSRSQRKCLRNLPDVAMVPKLPV